MGLIYIYRPYIQDTCVRAVRANFFSFGATAPIWPLAYLHETLGFTSVYYILRHLVGLLGRVISSSQGLYLYTNTEKRTYTNIHALSGIRTPDPGFRASEDSACPRPLGYRDRHVPNTGTENSFK
jgi:hypothetical protein